MRSSPALDRPSVRPLSSFSLTRRASLGLVTCILAAVAAAAAAGRKADPSPSEATLELYRSKCQQCHMADGNSPLEPLNFSDGEWRHGSKPEEVAKTITEGVSTTAMLPFKAQLTEEQIADLAAYVRSFDKNLKATRKTK
jgi:mono/diheme cytochrome c family protein